MSTIQDIINAANQTVGYIEKMKMPEKSQAITKYATIKKGKLEDEGFVMLSPSRNKRDKMSAIAGIIASPFLFISAANDMDDKTIRNSIDSETVGITPALVTVKSGAAIFLLYSGITRLMAGKKAETLVFPKSR